MKVIVFLLMGVFIGHVGLAAYEYELDNQLTPVKSGLGIVLAWRVKYHDPGVRPTAYKYRKDGTFKVYRDGTLIATLNDVGGYTDYETIAGHSYSYTVTSVTWNCSCSYNNLKCYGSYGLTVDQPSYVLSPDVNWITFGTATHYTYDKQSMKTTATSCNIVIKNNNSDWITKVVGESAWKILANTSGSTRVATVTVSPVNSAVITQYDQVVTITQLPDTIAANGKNSYWDCYVAGLDCEDASDTFKTLLSFDGGTPIISWTPDLNENGTKSIRIYKIWGRETLGDDSKWEYPTNSLHRFFKVTVEMK